MNSYSLPCVNGVPAGNSLMVLALTYSQPVAGMFTGGSSYSARDGEAGL